MENKILPNGIELIFDEIEIFENPQVLSEADEILRQEQEDEFDYTHR